MMKGANAAAKPLPRKTRARHMRSAHLGLTATTLQRTRFAAGRV